MLTKMAGDSEIALCSPQHRDRKSRRWLESGYRDVALAERLDVPHAAHADGICLYETFEFNFVSVGGKQ